MDPKNCGQIRIICAPNHEVTCDFPIRDINIYITIYIAYLWLGQKVRYSLSSVSPIVNLTYQKMPIFQEAHLMCQQSYMSSCHGFLLVAKIIYQFETFNIIRLLSEILHQLRYCIHHKNQRIIYLLPYQRVQDFFHHFYSGFTRRFASQLLRKSSHPQVQYRINHRNLLAAISIKTMNTH